LSRLKPKEPLNENCSSGLNDTPKPVEDFVGAFCLIIAHFATIRFEGLISRDRRPVIGSPV
jgi:hypothetical protein